MLMLLDRTVIRTVFALPTRVHALLAGGAIHIDGDQLDPTLQLMLTLRRAKGLPDPLTETPEDARRRWRRETRLSPGKRYRMASVQELVVDGAEGELLARHYVPIARPDEGPLPLLVFFHGGGWAVCDLDTHDHPCRMLAERSRVQVLSVDYRLAPEHPYPAARHDALASFRWARANAESLGADAGCVLVGGDSAGGNLSAHVAQDLVEAGEESPALQLLLYPSVDVGADGYASTELFADRFFLTLAEMARYAEHYLGNMAPDVEFVTPLRSGIHAGLAPAIIATAGFDPLRDEGEAYAAALEAAGTPARLMRMPGMLHGFMNMGGVSRAAQRASHEVCDVLREELATVRGAAAAARQPTR